MREFLLGIVEITLGMSLLILLMLVILKLIGGKFTAKCRYVLWTLVLVRLAVPVSFGLLPALIEVPVEREPEPVQIQMQVPTVEYTPVPQNPVVVQPQEQVQTPKPHTETPMFTEPEPEPVTWKDVQEYIPYIYLAGVMVFLLWNLLSYLIYTAKILRSARQADENTIEIYEAVCRKKELHRPPILLVSHDVNSPAAFGLLRRRIVLPDIVFTENGLAGTLAHEVTHCKRGDLWIKAICLLARSFHWFNPLSHLAAFRCEMEMELSCDESVLAGCDENTRAAYGEVMLDIIRRCRRNRGALTTHFNPKKNAVKAGFTNILYGSGKKRGLWLIGVCLVLCLIAGAIVACRVEAEPEEEDIPTLKTAPLPDGVMIRTPVLYGPYEQEMLSDLLTEEIPETEITEILQDEELCGVRVILYLDENELFCAAYEKDGTLFRFINTGGVKPVSFEAAEFSGILEEDGFSVSWAWSHLFRYYFTVENGTPVLFLSAPDSVTEADYDQDGVTEVICQTYYSVRIYDIKDGELKIVGFDGNVVTMKPGEFFRYLPEKNWFEFDYKKDGDDTLYHRYGVVEDGVLTLVTPDIEAEDTVSSSLVNILSQNSDLQVHTVYIPVAGQNPSYHTYRLDDRYTIYQTYDRGDRWDEDRIAENIKLWVVDSLTGTIAASYPIGDEQVMNEIGYTDTGCVIYRFEKQNGNIVVPYAVQIDNHDGYFTFNETVVEAYPQKRNYIRTPDGNTAAYRTEEDIEGNHGIDVKYPDGTIIRILTGETGSIQSAISYTPIAFLDDYRLVYSVIGGKYHISFGIYNIDTHENMPMDGAYNCLGVHDGVVYAAYENGGDFNYGIYESELWAIRADGTKTMLAATHNVPDGVTALSMEEYYLFKNGMWIFYETGDISGYSSGEDPSEILKVRLMSADLRTTCLQIEYPYAGDSISSLLTYGDSVTVAIPVAFEESASTLAGLETYRSRGVISEAVYEFYFNLLSGQSAIPEYNTLVIEDYTIRPTDDDRTTEFQFTVKESGMDTLPAGEYHWTVKDLLEVSVTNRRADDEEFHAIPEVKKLCAFLSGTYIYNTPTYGKGYEYPGMHNYICNYYSDVFSLEPEEYKRIAQEEFGVTDFTPMDLETWTLDDGLIHAGGIGGSWFGDVEDVMEDDTTVTVVMQFYADCNYLLKSHKIAYFFGTDGTWQGYRILELSDREPCGLHYVTDNNPKLLWQNFLDDVLAPYQEYIVATEFLDLDENGIDELIVYDWGASANCGVEIFTIENGEVRSFYTGTNAITHFDGNGAKVLAPPSVYAADQPFWGMQTSNNNGKTKVPLWFQPCKGVRGHILYSHNGSSTHSTDDYFYFTCGSDGLLQAVPLGSFMLEAVNDNYYDYGWHCYVNSEEVPADMYRSAEDRMWEEIYEQYGILFTAENVYDRDMLDKSPEYVMPEEAENVILAEEEIPAQEEQPVELVTEDSPGFTLEDWIKYILNTDFGFREPADVTALSDSELETYMHDAYLAALDIYNMHYICSDRMYGRRYWSSEMPSITVDGRPYSQMFNPVFPTLADWESYMLGILSPELTGELMETKMFINHDGELWGIMGARGTDISRMTAGYSVTSRTDTEIIYTAEVEVRETDLSAEEPDYVEYYDFTYTLTDDGWRWTDFYLYY